MATSGRLCVRCVTSVQRQAVRAFTMKPRIFEEEERAKENVYIQKMERERLEKLKKKLLKEKQAGMGADKGEAPSGSNPSERENQHPVG